ncbi:MAG: DUF1232 domain-containing protein [Rhizobiales bacterium]|nr:DUF1232 domain-containing protein [Hyphomicrobiales bacterium]MBN9009836.1 DUF1232 domain-containing protein [Hyphomicrobiales bacterium]
MSDVKYGEILEPEEEAERAERVRSRFWRTFRRAARAIPFAEDLVAAYYCALDPAVPARVRGVLLAALAYFILPFDAIPDMIAGLGFTDDATILLATIGMVRAHITEVHREAARRALDDAPAGKPAR